MVIGFVSINVEGLQVIDSSVVKTLSSPLTAGGELKLSCGASQCGVLLWDAIVTGNYMGVIGAS